VTQRSAAERKDVREAEKAASLVRSKRYAYTREIMSTSAGREWLWDLLAGCGVFSNPFTSDDRMTAFSCGAMNVGQQLLVDIMAACPDAYIQAMREANERSTIAEQSRGADSDGRDQGADGGDSTAGAEDSADDGTYVDYSARPVIRVN